MDLGDVGEVARVYLNGDEVGTRVFPPYQFNISKHIKVGSNRISIEVGSTWRNQLISDAKKPLEQQNTRINGGSKPASCSSLPSLIGSN